MTTPEKILIIGATGNVGSVVIPNLAAAGASIRALVRDGAKAQSLRDVGVEVVTGDLDNSETLDGAFSGVDKVFLLTAVGPNEASQAINAITVAKQRADSPHIVKLSARKPTSDASPEHTGHHSRVEKELKNSGLPYTIIKSNFFMQNTMLAAQNVISDGAVYLPFNDSKIGMVDVRDVGEAVAKVLTSDGHEDKTYTLTGPASISIHDVAADLSQALGKKVNYVAVPLEAAREAMLSMGMPEWVAKAYTEYFKMYSAGWGDYTTHNIEQLTGHPARSYQTFARDFTQVFSPQ
jgi:uncharacterized protein YbjT (DUF2867 family)